MTSLINAYSVVNVGLTDWEPEFGNFLNNIYEFYPKNLDVNSGNPLGASVCQISARHGRRTTASGAYLSNAPSNLTVITDTIAERILFDQRKAVGVITNKETISKTSLSDRECHTLTNATQSTQIRK